jgi:hypothetical protein
LSQTPPGWYPDPQDPTSTRYWDGENWTENRAPAQEPLAPTGPQKSGPNLLLIAIPVAIAVVAVIVILATGGDGDGGGGDFPESAQDNFITQCEATSGGNTSYCECALDKIQQEVSYDEFQDIDAAVLGGESLPEEITDGLAECL